jgi:hypothetical protein
MSDETVNLKAHALTQKEYDQISELVTQLIGFCQHQDNLNKLSDPMSYPGEGFITAKLKLIKDVLENGCK